MYLKKGTTSCLFHYSNIEPHHVLDYIWDVVSTRNMKDVVIVCLQLCLAFSPSATISQDTVFTCHSNLIPGSISRFLKTRKVFSRNLTPLSC